MVALRKLSIDVVVWLLATPLAYLVRFDFVWREGAWTGLLILLAIGLPVKTAAVVGLRLHRQSWRTFTFRDIGPIARAIASVTALMFVSGLAISQVVFLPRSVPLIDGAIALLMMFGVRAGWRWYFELLRAVGSSNGDANRVVIVGAGEAGVMVAKEMQRHPETGIVPVGFVDDQPQKQGLTISGIPVLGTVADLPVVLRERDIAEVVIAVPSAEGRFVRRVIDSLQGMDEDVRYRVMPGVYELLSGDVSVSRLRDVEVEDLLRRKPVDLDLASIAEYVNGETVLVTGAGGSIGSEIVRQLTMFRPAKLLLLGRGENSIVTIQNELRARKEPIEAVALVADVRDRGRLAAIFDAHGPTVVFHAAANKHVPLMEINPTEAVHNNVLGTRHVAEMALRYEVKRLVNISTDKAVNPSSVMGMSKSLAERVVRAAARQAGSSQRFVSVRFGNVLGSRGSVVPIFREQIRNGGPVTVTHPDMTRYFMTIPEAAQLVLQAGGLAENGRVYILDMGEPVRIVDLAEDLIRLSGLEPHADIEIVFTGVRPGEKIHEELMTEVELAGATRHAMIHVAEAGADVDWRHLSEELDDMVRLIQEGRDAQLLDRLATIVREVQVR